MPCPRPLRCLGPVALVPDAGNATNTRRAEFLWAIAVLLLAAWFYGWTATSAGSPLTAKLQPDDLYNRLADGFLAGRLSFLETPNPALAQLADPWDPAQNGPLRQFHDVSYYDGKYFLYFGAAPALLLLAPWKALTGTYLPQNVAVAVFAWGGAMAGVALVLALRRKYFPGGAAWVTGLCFLAVAFGNFVPVLLRRPVYYELAIASAHAFSMAALLCVARALEGERTRRVWLALASASFGFAVASRPNYVFGAVLLAAPLLPIWRERATTDRRVALRDGLAAALPFLGCIALLLLYNLLRFGSFTEFGTSYMFSGMHPQRDVMTSFRFAPVNLWYYLFAPAQLTAFFPFFQVIHMPWFAVPAGYTGEENVYGLLPNLPFLWMLAAWIWCRRGAPVALRDFALGAFALVAFNALVLCRLGGAANRYLVDLVPPLLPLACVGVFWAEEKVASTAGRVALRVLWVGTLTWTLAFNVFVSLQHNELLRYHNPATYARLAHAFNHVSIWLGQTGSQKTGPLRVKVILPQGRSGQLEPLLVTGLSFRADFIYLYYTDDRHLQIGFEHTSYGGPVTKPPLEVDYTAEHTLELELGSLWPPVEHPFYDGWAAAEIARRKRTLRVVLDGREVLAATCDFYDSSPGDVSIGRNPVSDAFGRRFTGQVLGVERIKH